MGRYHALASITLDVSPGRAQENPPVYPPPEAQTPVVSDAVPEELMPRPAPLPPMEPRLEQRAAPPPAVPRGIAGPAEWSARASNAHQGVWSATVIERDEGTGRERVRRHEFVELGSGLHYRDEAGEWRRTREEFEIMPDGRAVARFGPHRLTVEPNLNSPTAVDLVTADGARLRSGPLAVGYYDPVTGANVIIATVRDVGFALTAPNELTFPSAFDGLDASIRVTYRRAGMSADLILHEWPPEPEALGLSPSSRLEMYTEFDPATPVPRQTVRVWRREADPARRQAMVEPDLVDHELEFGTYQMGTGVAFDLAQGPRDAAPLPVAKVYRVIEGRPVLIEAIEWREAKPLLAALPRQANAERVARLAANVPMGAARRLLPERRLAAALPARDRTRMLAAADPRPGFVLDYTLVTGATDFTFEAGRTYFVKSDVYLAGHTVFEGGAVIKYAPGAALRVRGTPHFDTREEAPLICTSQHDDSVGETLPGSTGNPWTSYGGSPALEFDGFSGALATAKHLRVSHAATAVAFFGEGHEVRHAQFVHCSQVFTLAYAEARLRNVLAYQVDAVVGGGPWATVHFEHLTARLATTFNQNSSATVWLTNSLLSEVTTPGAYAGVNNAVAVPASAFATAGAGAHYLAGSTYRGLGTVNIDPDLLTEIRARTTQPPSVLASGYLAGNHTLNPRPALRYAPAAAPDYGYHYPVVDYLYGHVALEEASLRLNAGVVLGLGLPTPGTYGLALTYGSSLAADGSPTNLVRLVRTALVQEQAGTAWAHRGPSVALTTETMSALELRLRFARFALGTEDALLDSGSDETLALRDCQVLAGRWDFLPGGTVGVTNCLFDRSHISVFPWLDTPVAWRNNLFRSGTFDIGIESANLSVRDNLFDRTAIPYSANVTSSHNGYVTGADRLQPPQATDRVLAGLTYDTGPLGGYYLPAGSALINAGSRTASAAGMFHYTTAASQAKDTATVDIGLHYVALNGASPGSVPLDSEADGVPDYLEDTDGDGTVDVGEPSWTRADSPFVRRHEPLGPSSRRTPLVISEIMYKYRLQPNEPSGEFIEIYNTHYMPIDLSGFQLRFGLGQGIPRFTFPANTVLAPQAFLIVVRDMAAYPGVPNKVGPYTENLPNGSETIRLVNALGAVLLEIDYNDNPPWPVQADGTKHSLVLAHPSFGENDVRAWAASQWRGGSPGSAETNPADPLNAIRINEFSATGTDFVELYNACNHSVDVSGCFLSYVSDALTLFQIPPGSVIPPRGFLQFIRYQNLPYYFDINHGPSGDDLFLTNPQQTRVIDALCFGGQSQGASTGRAPDGAPELSELSIPTPGLPNIASVPQSIVINEIMFNPISGNDNDEYIEIYNAGMTAQSLSGWSISGVNFITFASFQLQPGAYVVVARDAAHLASRYPGQLTLGANLIGDYGVLDASLADSGERIALIDSNGVVVDEVTYSDGGRWGRWTDGGGASLELIDDHSDNRRASNWKDSAPPSSAAWTTMEVTGIIQNGDGINPANAIELMMLEAGECLVDNVEVIPSGAGNLVANGTFDSGTTLQVVTGDVNGTVTITSGGATNATCCTGAMSLPTGWHVQGSHDLSTLASGQGIGGSTCLKVRATGRGDHVGNRVFYQWNPGTVLAGGSTCTIRASVKWLRGHPELLFRIRGNYLEAVATMTIPSNLGTPGQVNSQPPNNMPPAITEVTHFPVVPLANELVRVSARVSDPNGVSTVNLRYRVGSSTTYTQLAMNDTGQAGDALAGDGLYTATLPAQASGAVAAFVVEANDSLSQSGRFPAAEILYPGDPFQRECVVRYGEGDPSGDFAAYRIWMTPAIYNQWVQRTKIHNSPLDVTFVYGNSRAIYSAGARYAGSVYHSALYDTPTGSDCNYTMSFPSDDRLLGATAANFDFDDSSPRYFLSEQLAMWMAGRLRLPFNHRRFVHLYVHGVHRANAYEDSQRPNGDFLEQWFSGNDQGQLFKLEVWWKSVNFPLGNVNYRQGSLERFTRTWPGGVTSLDLPSYRLTWLPRAVNGSANDYSQLSTLIDAVENPNAPGYFATVNSLIDYEQWMRVFAFERAVINGDSYGFGNGHNMYAYHDLGGGLKWNLLMTDFDGVFQDNGLGTSGDPFLLYGVSSLTDNAGTDPKVAAVFNHPPFRRAFWRCLYDMANPTDGCMISSRVNPVFDAHYSALSANDFSLPSATASTADKNWIASRRAYLWSQVQSVRPTFRITTPNGTHSPTAIFTLEGEAPVEVKDIKLNGAPVEVLWTSATTWSLTTTLSGASTQLTVTGHGWDGAQLPERDIGDYTDTITVYFP